MGTRSSGIAFATKTEIWERSGIDLSQVPPLMDVNDLVDAALIGFDRKETITLC